MPLQAVTLEPMVQGERVVAILRLLGGPSMHTNCESSHSVGTQYRLRGLARWRTSQRNFTLAAENFSFQQLDLFELCILAFRYATLF